MTEFNRYDIMEAWWVFLSDYHEGQGSDKYRRLSQMLRRFFPSSVLYYQTLTSNGKAIYDNLVKKETKRG